jgi:hypothetical protein
LASRLLLEHAAAFESADDVSTGGPEVIEFS